MLKERSNELQGEIDQRNRINESMADLTDQEREILEKKIHQLT